MNIINTSGAQTITLANGSASVVSSGGSVLVNRIPANSIGIDDEEEDDEMNEEGEFSEEEEDETEMLEGGGSELTTQLAAAGWTHGVILRLY